MLLCIGILLAGLHAAPQANAPTLELHWTQPDYRSDFRAPPRNDDGETVIRLFSVQGKDSLLSGNLKRNFTTKVFDSLLASNRKIAILLCRNDTLHHSLDLNAFHGASIRIGPYGAGKLPVISGLHPLHWEEKSPQLWQSSLPTGCSKIISHRTSLELAQSPASDSLQCIKILGPKTYHLNKVIDSLWLPSSLLIQGWNFKDDIIKIDRIHKDTVFLAFKEDDPVHKVPFSVSILNNQALLRNAGDYAVDSSSKQAWIRSESSPLDVSCMESGNAIQADSIHGLRVDSIEITGFANSAAYFKHASKILLNRLEIHDIGFSAIYIGSGNRNTITASRITDIGNRGLEIHSDSSDLGFNQISRIGLKKLPEIHARTGCWCNPEMGGSNAIFSAGKGNLIQWNSIDSTAYTGIDFRAPKQVIKNNFITDFCLRESDGAGIYTWTYSYSKRISDSSTISENTVVLSNQSHKMVEGIYLDDFTKSCQIHKNIVINTHKGIYFHHTRNHRADHNIIINSGLAGFSVQEEPKRDSTKGNSFSHNRVLILSQSASFLQFLLPKERNVGLIDSNDYLSPNAALLQCNGKRYDLPQTHMRGYEASTKITILTGNHSVRVYLTPSAKHLAKDCKEAWPEDTAFPRLNLCI